MPNYIRDEAQLRVIVADDPNLLAELIQVQENNVLLFSKTRQDMDSAFDGYGKQIGFGPRFSERVGVWIAGMVMNPLHGEGNLDHPVVDKN